MMRVLSVEQLFERTLDRLPRRLGDFIWNIVQISTYITLPTSFLSAIYDLRIVGVVARWLSERLSALQPMLLTAADAASFVVGLWRTFTAPLRDWMFSWLPWTIEPLWFDVAVCVLLPVPSVLRWILAQRAHRRRALEKTAISSALGSDYDSTYDPRWKMQPRRLWSAGMRASFLEADARHAKTNARSLLFLASALGIVGVALVLLDFLTQRG